MTDVFTDRQSIGGQLARDADPFENDREHGVSDREDQAGADVVLITGCSTGIGRAATETFARAGYRVVATARQPETLAGVDAALILALDVTDPASIDAAVGRMFDANVLGIIRMVQAVARVMRRQGSGRIVNVGSLAGKLSGPSNGTYSATKYALESLSDTLRWELEPFGIHVVLVEPGAIGSAFEQRVARESAHCWRVRTGPMRRCMRALNGSARACAPARQDQRLSPVSSWAPCAPIIPTPVMRRQCRSWRRLRCKCRT